MWERRETSQNSNFSPNYRLQIRGPHWRHWEVFWLVEEKNRRDRTNSCTSRVFIFSLLILIQRQASANLRCQASFWLGLNSPRCDMLHLHHPMHQVSSGCYTVICYTSTTSASQCSVAATPLPSRDAPPLHTECSALQPVCDAAGKA